MASPAEPPPPPPSSSDEAWRHHAPRRAFVPASNVQTPLALPLSFRPAMKHHRHDDHPLNLDALRRSLASAADGCLGFLHSVASRSPLVGKVLSLHSDFRSICRQIHCRSSRNVISLSGHNFAAVLPGGDSLAGLVVANGISNFLNIYNTLLVARLVLTWFPNAPPAIVSPLSTLCDPYLNIFRGIIPPLGGTLDFSPILAFLALNAFTSAAAALPAELPPTLASQENAASCISSATTSQKKWVRRLSGHKQKSTTGPF
ncbi:ylmG homolog protein 2, chloroplastic [Syzygium oleosum]|uniref:ylmG homolog protein 2, chloroplastic n=1 Tax=Syzygium oleosum TaxID=219896 RepID=UPI0011D230F0|nr:ylmG homolog protein 2, chloroplastic [Syzygium oleosum]